MSVQLQRWVFTVDEYTRMAEAGILSEDDRTELIEGEIIRMSPIGKRHASIIIRLTRILGPIVGDNAFLSIQNPLQLDSYSQPQPDIALLKPREDLYADGIATPESVLLLIEVCDSSLSYDKEVKLLLYAKAGIPEVWIEDLPGDKIEAYSNPVKGKYQNSRIIRRGDSISPERLPVLVFKADDL